MKQNINQYGDIQINIKDKKERQVRKNMSNVNASQPKHAYL